MKDTYFGYLFGLQESGVTNMFGAASYLVKEFNISNSEARDVLMEWMNNYESIAQRLGIEV